MSAKTLGEPWDSLAQRAGVDPATFYAVVLHENRWEWDDGLARPWPWRVRWSGGDHRYDSRAEAEAALHQILATGARNIDVGLGQVNVRENGQRVEHAENLLDPTTNLTVAADILRAAVNSTPDRTLGLGRYHNWKDEQRARRYGRAVQTLASRLRQHFEEAP